jgi:hypothetical protein
MSRWPVAVAMDHSPSPCGRGPGGGGRILQSSLIPDAPQHRAIHLLWDWQPSSQPVRQFILRYLKQRLQHRKLRLVECVYVTLHEATEQDVVLVRPAVGGAIQQTAAPRIERG